jgi:hypothetical protein
MMKNKVDYLILWTTLTVFFTVLSLAAVIGTFLLLTYTNPDGVYGKAIMLSAVIICITLFCSFMVGKFRFEINSFIDDKQMTIVKLVRSEMGL